MGKHKTQHSMRLQNIILTLSLCGLISCNSSNSVFTDETYQDTIKQNIGGLLIRNIHHYDDFNSWIYDIDYLVDNKSDSLKVIGSGSFYCQKPPKDQQLIKLDKWIILKTCSDRNADVIFICDSSFRLVSKNIISPKTIEQEDLWKSQNIESSMDNWDSVAKIEQIDSKGQISVIYTYAKKKRIPFFKTSKRKLIYSIDNGVGRLKLTKVIKL